MDLNKKRFNITYLIFLTIAIVYAIGNFIWWQINCPIIPFGISAVHFLDIFYEGWLFYNAPLITWIMRGMFYVFGKEYYDLIVIFVNYIFFLIPLYFTYKIGVELKDKETGNIAMILFALVPAVYGMSRQYGHKDYHIIAAITFNIYCLIKTDYFKDRKWTILYGISVGLGLMIKDAFLAYFFVPFVYIAIAGLREKIEKTKIINILISILIGSLIAGWHYFRPRIIEKIWYDPIRESHPVFHFQSLKVMTTGLWEDILSPPIFIIFIIGVIYFIWKYKGKYKNIILLWFFVPWAIIMLMPHHKLPEYGAGFIPMMVLVGAISITAIEKHYVKKVLILLLIIIGILQYIQFSYVSFIKIFNVKLKINEYKISYYNRYSPLMISNKKQVELVYKLTKYLSDNYYRETFFIDQPCIVVDKFSIVAQMFLNGILYKQWVSENADILAADIIIVVGIPKTIDEKKKYAIKQMLINPVQAKIFDENLKNEIINKTEYLLNNVKKEYHVIDKFYLEKNKNDETKVTLLGKKDKFPQFFE